VLDFESRYFSVTLGALVPWYKENEAQGGDEDE
jgi:hypothetical protein